MADPPITSAPSPPSAPGIAQPVIVAGGESLPPSFPLGTAGTWLPPPQVGQGENEPFPTPVVPPGVMSPWPTQQPALPPQPQFPTGSATAPASLFPEFTAAGPSPPIIVSALQPPPPVPLPLPTTPGILAIALNGWGLGAGPGGEGNAAIFPAGGAGPVTPPPATQSVENAFDAPSPRPKAPPKPKHHRSKRR